jgi:hypothetical protein
MVLAFFRLAVVSPGRQLALRNLAILHIIMVSSGGAVAFFQGSTAIPLLGHVVLIAGIVEGALLIGWRLTQLPKSRALEFLLVSPLRPRQLFLAEALVGLSKLALITLAALPVYALLVVQGILLPTDLAALLLMPWFWGAICGMTLVTWAYEHLQIRRWGERVLMVLVVIYLAVGVLAGEKLAAWVVDLPPRARYLVLEGYRNFHSYSPFTVLRDVLRDPPEQVLDRFCLLQAGAMASLIILAWRSAIRLQEHFRDRHYLPVADLSGKRRQAVGDRPLTWWAVKRVSEYSGRVNLWLAGGFAILYAAYTVAGECWPSWLGRQAFETFDRMGGVPAVAAALAVLAAVPAAFQYGLWDSSKQDRCRRLELLLLTDFDTSDYWHAAAAAAWRRGRGYFMVAMLLWAALVLAGRAHVVQVTAALAAAVVLWGLYFTLGFRAFARGLQANTLGLGLTLGLPLLACLLFRCDLGALAALVPPGGVYYPTTSVANAGWLPGSLAAGVLTLVLGRLTQQHGLEELRRWYDQHQGQKSVD